MTQNASQINAGIIIIGNEILSGKTQDVNTSYMARGLGSKGIPLHQVRIVPDIEQEIISAVLEFHKNYSYVFTTGGIGPTHDDITAKSIAKAFGRDFGVHTQAQEILLGRYGEEGLTEGRLRMAYMPHDVRLINNPVSQAPGFQIENVYVMAGIPDVMQSMFDGILAELTGNGQFHSLSVSCYLTESEMAADLEQVQLLYSDLDLGSYPFWHVGRHGTSIVVRGLSEEKVGRATQSVAEMVLKLGGEPTIANAIL